MPISLRSMATFTPVPAEQPLDMMLKLIGDDFDANLVNKICEQALTDRVRSPQDRQRLPLRARLGIQNSKVLTIIEMMEANLQSRRH